MGTISRRHFLERSLKLAGLAGFGGTQLKGFTEPESRRFFGAQTHFGQFRPGAADVLDLIKGAGIAWIRDEVYWSEVEKEKGVFKFPPAYEHYLRAALGRGI